MTRPSGYLIFYTEQLALFLTHTRCCVFTCLRFSKRLKKEECLSNATDAYIFCVASRAFPREK